MFPRIILTPAGVRARTVYIRELYYKTVLRRGCVSVRRRLHLQRMEECSRLWPFKSPFPCVWVDPLQINPRYYVRKLVRLRFG